MSLTTLSTIAEPTRSRIDPLPDPVERAHRAVTVRLTDGFDGAHCVVTMLRTRRYVVRDLSMSVRDGLAVSEVRCTVVATTAEAVLLLERLRRIPVVVSAEHG